ncbi:MAG: OmpA family protein [Candidatus Symbiobacter sp.]|nr:OmpA family protein [Candidatus Symbiobacter sp.]
MSRAAGVCERAWLGLNGIEVSMAGKLGKNSEIQPIYKRGRHKKHGAAHGSQTWKIALADFMTSMFIIFMLLWILKEVNPVTRAEIAQYFSPTTPSPSTSGAGKPLAGEVAAMMGQNKEQASQLGPPGGGPGSPDEGAGTTSVAGYTGTVMRKTGDRPTSVTMETEGRLADIQHQEILAVQIKQTLAENPELQAMQGNVSVEQTPQGLQIQLMDSDKTAMFTSSGLEPLPATKKLIIDIAKKIQDLPNPVAIAGHTDATPFAKGNEKFSNWDLSTARANAARRILSENGVNDNRIDSVAGKAANDPLFPDNPTAPGNRRITITLLNVTGNEGLGEGSTGGGGGGSGSGGSGSGGGKSGSAGGGTGGNISGNKAGKFVDDGKPASAYLKAPAPGPGPEGSLVGGGGKAKP